MVSDSWETSQTLWGDAVLCQDHHEIKMKAQMSIFSVIHMFFVVGLTRIQDGGEISIGSHYNMALFLMSNKDNLSACQLLLSRIFIIFKSRNTLIQLFWTFNVFKAFIFNCKVGPITHHQFRLSLCQLLHFPVWWPVGDICEGQHWIFIPYRWTLYCLHMKPSLIIK